MFAEIIVDISHSEVDKIFDYKAIEGLHAGQRVIVPFGNQVKEGFCLAIKDNTSFDEQKVKSVIKIIDEPINSEMLALLPYMRRAYNLRMVDILRLFLPSEMRVGRVKEKTKKIVTLTDENGLEKIKKNAFNQIGAFHYVLSNKQVDFTKLCTVFSNSAVNTLIKNGIFKTEDVTVFRRPKIYERDNKKVDLTAEQKNVYDTISHATNQKFLIHGVTGSGKTEVYMRLIEDCVANGKTAIMLVPEISLTAQMLSIFCDRFQDNVAIIHSGLSAGERFDEWRRIKDKQAKIVIGVRSAIFSPIENVGIIIIDEEHDTSYYSESNPRYWTHEIAKFRADYNGANLVLGSATPSVETYYYAKCGEYTLLKMPHRINNKAMPEIKIVDMCAELSNGNSTPYSYALQNGLKNCLEENHQAIIFLNRRGYSSFQKCNECGYIAKCTDCDVSLVVHKEDNLLKCHYCGKRFKLLTKCPMCQSESIRMGAIGTQHIVEDLLSNFKVPIFRMDIDSTRGKNGHQDILGQFSEAKPSILVGTQMIAKGHDFPSVTFVGIIDADLSLHFSDFRSNERTFQLVTQVAGRAGRGDFGVGQVVLQTYVPRHYVYNLAVKNDYESFYEREINLREVTNFPPFANIVRILFTGEDEIEVKNALKRIYDKIKEIKRQRNTDFFYLEAMNSPLKRLQSKFRYQILMRYKRESHSEIIENIYKIVDEESQKKVSIFVEINSQNLS